MAYLPPGTAELLPLYYTAPCWRVRGRNRAEDDAPLAVTFSGWSHFPVADGEGCFLSHRCGLAGAPHLLLPLLAGCWTWTQAAWLLQSWHAMGKGGYLFWLLVFPASVLMVPSLALQRGFLRLSFTFLREGPDHGDLFSICYRTDTVTTGHN